VTDPTGPCFLSYKRERATEAGLLVDALRDHGIPTWQDVLDLPSDMTETALEHVLSDPETSGAVLLATPEVELSNVIRKIEVPRIFSRAARRDGFFAIPIAAGKLSYGDMARVLGPGLGLTDIASYNVMRATDDPLDGGFAASVARRALRERISAIHRSVDAGEALTLQVSTRVPLPKSTGITLRADLTHRFEGRQARPDAWEQHLLPAFAAVAMEIARSAPGRMVEVTGFLALPAAVALGAAMPSLGPVRAAWLQEQAKFGVTTERWSLADADQDCGFTSEVRPQSPSAEDLALLVSVTNDVVHDFTLSRVGLPLRAVVHLKPADPRPARVQLGPGQARNLACLAVDAVRDAVAHYSARGTVHLFLAAPSGIAFMIGQQLNTLGRVQTYEHDPAGPTPYLRAVLLKPSS
jgi:hypothetical protein